MHLMTEILLELIPNSELPHSGIRFFSADAIDIWIDDWRFFLYIKEHEIFGAELRFEYCLERPGYDPQEAADRVIKHVKKYYDGYMRQRIPRTR